MRNAIAALIAGTALTLVPVAGLASAPASQAKAASPASTASHATTGVVKSIGDTAMVITRSGRQAGEMTFDLNASTHREGSIHVGSPVSVRYRDNGSMHVATAIKLEHSK
jgi:hypothetical protein